MNWYKYAQRIVDFQDRTEVNDNIDSLEKIAETLAYAGLLVFQTARGAKNVVVQIANHKKLSTYDEIREMLHEAENIALDSPNRFRDVCHLASKKVLQKVRSLQLERKKFVDRLSIKGLPDDK